MPIRMVVMITVAVAVLAGGVAVGMSNDGGPQPEGAPATIRLTLTDDGSSVSLAEGSTLIVAVEGNPTTGYTWEPQGLDTTVLRLAGEPAYQPDSDLVGSGGTMTFTFEGVGAGETELVLVYHRPWEEEDPLETFTVAVTVE